MAKGRPKLPLEYKKCLMCDVVFPFRSSLKKRGDGKRNIRSVITKYCSNPCRLKATIERNKKWNPSPEIRKRLGQLSRERMKGVPISEERRLKMRQTVLRGDKSNLWRGGKSTENALLRTSFEYRVWREAVFKRDDYTCRFCGVKGGKLTADHIKPWALYPELRFDLKNGRTLCLTCHMTTDTWGARFAHLLLKVK